MITRKELIPSLPHLLPSILPKNSNHIVKPDGTMTHDDVIRSASLLLNASAATASTATTQTASPDNSVNTVTSQKGKLCFFSEILFKLGYCVLYYRFSC